MRQRIRWFALHGVVRGLSRLGLRNGDPQARLIADPAVRENPGAFADELRDKGPLIRCRAVLMTVDHGVAHELLRSDDFRVTELGGNLPKPLRWIAKKTDPGLLHPLRPPSLLSVEPPDHTRYRKLVSSVFTPRAVATLRERVEETATTLLDQL
jgi:cytochrome P450